MGMWGGVERAGGGMRQGKLRRSARRLGGVETLVTRPVRTSHSGIRAEDRERIGISDRLIRVAVGIESAEDLCADFEQAMERL